MRPFLGSAVLDVIMDTVLLLFALPTLLAMSVQRPTRWLLQCRFACLGIRLDSMQTSVHMPVTMDSALHRSAPVLSRRILTLLHQPRQIWSGRLLGLMTMVFAPGLVYMDIAHAMCALAPEVIA